MDSLSQIVLGAGVAEVVLGKKAGNHALLWGAVAGTLPDLDIIPGQWMSTVEALAFHRGISHSLLFAIVLSPLLGKAVSRLYRHNCGSFGQWSLLFFLVLSTHALLDCFTTWGVQLFWPFPHRLAWKSIFVVDPLYTLPYLCCIIWLMTKRRESEMRRRLAIIGLTISSGYLLFTLINKQIINRVFEEAFRRQNLEVERYDSRPAPLQNLLWTVNAETKDAFYIGYYSHLDEDKNIHFQRFPKLQILPAEMEKHPEIIHLKMLTQGWYNLVEKENNHWVFQDFRFGQTGGYTGENAEFVFSYDLRLGENGKVSILERETTSARAGKELLKSLWKRIKGEKAQTSP